MDAERKLRPVMVRWSARSAVITAGLTSGFWSLAAPSSASGQSSADLDAAEITADAGDLNRARELLSGWLSARGGNADEARARFLRARLARDLDSAEVDYLWVAVEGSEPYGATARLRLAQLRLTRGQQARAEQDLERLRTDYPDSPLVLSSWLWTGNSRAMSGDMAGACRAWERAGREPARQASSTDRALTDAALAQCGPADQMYGEGVTFTVQLGAFGSRDAAVGLRNRAAETEATVRLVAPQEEGGLYRVRSGRFARREDAARHAVNLEAAGFDAIVVPEEP